jgi:ATP-binding cassette subfamily C protein CydD
LLGGLDLADCDPAVWRAQIAWVPQAPTLFRGSIADNIRLGGRSASDEDVETAARMAGADTIVARLPGGLATDVGEGFQLLSTGERQRIAIARAFLRDAPLVVLDEPTANLDPQNARLVADAVDRLRPGRTMLLIAHDAELARRADRVITFADGRIVEATT